MPTALLNAYAEQLPRLSAEEALLMAERVAVGSGSLKRGVGQRLASAWQRQAQQRRLIVRPQSREMYDAQMAMSGIAVRKVPKRDG